MRTFLYKDKKKDSVKQQFCESCKHFKSHEELAPHHIHHRGYSDVCVWVCIECHRKIHDTSYGYDSGFLRRRFVDDITMQKTRKKSLKKPMREGIV